MLTISASFLDCSRATICSFCFPSQTWRLSFTQCQECGFSSMPLFLGSCVKLSIKSTVLTSSTACLAPALLSNVQCYPLLLLPLLNTLQPNGSLPSGFCLQHSSRSACSLLLHIFKAPHKYCLLQGFCWSLYLKQNSLPVALWISYFLQKPFSVWMYTVYFNVYCSLSLFSTRMSVPWRYGF